MTIYDWINQWRVERPINTRRLSQRLRLAIENLADDDIEKLAPRSIFGARSAGGRKSSISRLSRVRSSCSVRDLTAHVR